MPVIYCRTNAADGLEEYGWARVELTVTEATRLLGYRPLLAAPAAHSDDFYGLEFFDYSPSFGVVRGRWTGRYDETAAGEWATPADVQPAFVESRTGCSTLLVTAGGVLWTGQPKHAGGEVETAVLDWAVLEKFAAGDETAFTPAEVGRGDDDPWGDDD